MSYRVEIRDSKNRNLKFVYFIDNNRRKEAERKVGSYSFSIHGVRLLYDSTFKIFAGDTLNGKYEPLPVFRRFGNNSLESRTAKLFLRVFSMGSEVGTIDVIQERVISALK